MASVKMSPNQEKACHEFGHNIIVSAGAGSGKTFVLSQRVLYFVSQQNFHITDFLIVTFTKLAAGEMKERIRKNLINAGLTEEANNVDIADICTFDSLMFSIVKKYHTLLNKSSNIKIVDSSIIETLVYNLIKEELEEEYGKEEMTELTKGIVNYCFKNDNDFVKSLVKCFEYFNNKPDFYNAIEDYRVNVLSKENIKRNIEPYFVQKLEALKDKVREALELVPDNKKASNSLSIHEQFENNYHGFIQSNDYDQAILSYPQKKTSFRSEYNVDEETRKTVDNTLSEVKKCVGVLPQKLEDIYEIENTFSFSNAILDLIVKVYDKVIKFKDEHQAYEFNDIAKMALKLIKENSEVRSELKNKYKMIMVDEYQDTSDIQEQFVNLIQDNNAYMVGDIKQSIYRFRNARPELFQNKYDLYKKNDGGIAIDLMDNYRSRPEVLNDINHIFEKLMVKNLGNIDYREHIIGSGNKDYLVASNVKQDMHMDLVMYGLPKGKRSVDDEIEATFIVEDIIQKYNSHYQVMDKDTKQMRDCRLSDFCIIVDRNSGTYETIEEAFKKKNIPLHIQYDENIAENDLLRILKNILIIIDTLIHLKDINTKEFKHAFASVARSFLFEKTDKYIYEAIKNNIMETDVIEFFSSCLVKYKDESNISLLKHILYDLNIYEKIIKIGDVNRNEKYLTEMMNKFQEMSDLDFDFADMITYIDNVGDYELKINISSTALDFDHVTLINIHKSKGLEYKICYFCMLHRAFNTRAPDMCSCDYGFWYDKQSPIYLLYSDKEKHLDVCEKIRLLYVALTRAEEKAIIVKPFANNIIDKFDDSNKIKSLSNMIDFLEDSDFCNKRLIEINQDLALTRKSDDENNEVLEYIPLPQSNWEVKEQKHASKKLKLESKENVLDFGTKLHFIMELMDFKNPNYSIIKDNKLEDYVKKFVQSDLLKNIGEECTIYKEFNFSDEVHNTSGIIDLFIKYQDHIDIIDYKTSFIDDPMYDNQLNVYKDYLMTITDLPINMYLYSLVKGTYRKVE